MDKRKIGRYLSEKRKQMGMTQAQLAEILDVSNKTISRWERGINLKACSLFRVNARDFLTGGGETTKESF